MTTYSISLDNVDLALLPLRTSYNNFLKKEHYQFELMKTVTFEVPEPSTRYTCHICAIDMPAAFAHEHTATIKHRANARIATVAAQRMLALISALPPSAADPTTRFCANCATVADDDHYNTREHREAATRDNLLWDLVKAYAQDDSKYQINLNRDENHDSECKNDGNNKNNNTMDGKASDKNQLTEEHIAKKSEIHNNAKQYNDNREFTNYINDNISMSSNIIKANTVVAVKSDILVEYPYEATAKGHLRCVVCECQVPSGVQSREEHIRGSNHRRMVGQCQATQPVEDEEDEQEEDYIRYSPPLINDNLEEYSKEESDKNDSKMSSNITEANDSDDIDSQIEYYIAKNSEIHSNAKQYNDKREFTNDINDNISMSSVTKANAVVAVKSDILVEYPYEATAKGHIRCLVCECQVPSGVQSREEHIRGSKHLRMVSQRQATQPVEDEEDEQEESSFNETNDNLEEYSEEEFDSKIISSNITEAYDGDDMDFQIEYPFEVTTRGQIECVICDCQVPNEKEGREEHVRGRRHRDMVFNKNQATEFVKEQLARGYEINYNLQENREEISDNNNDNGGMNCNITEANYTGTVDSLFEYPFEVTATGHVECVICDCQVPSGEESREEHIRGRRHRNMKNRATGSIEDNEDEELIDGHTDNSMNSSRTESSYEEYEHGNTIAEAQIEYPFELTTTGHVKCVVCECKVPSNVRSREEHINGMRHRNMVIRMNQPEESIEEDELSAENSEIYDSFEEYSEDEEYIDENTDSDGNTSVEIEYPYEMTTTGIRCVVCGCQVPSGEQNRREHINGWRHRNIAFNDNQATEYIEEEEQIAEDYEYNDSSENEEFTDDDATPWSIVNTKRRL